jgi:hypothetical protein
MKKQLDSATLAQFIGSESFYKFSPLFRALLTDGAQYVAETAGAFWLMDIIGSYQNQLRGEDMQVWKLIPNKTTSGAKVVCENGNKIEILSQRIPFTDFPFINGEEFVLWACRNEFGGVTIMLPSEY